MTHKRVRWLAVVAFVVLAGLLLRQSSLSASSTQGQIYYVRTDGGSTSACTGLADAAYPGSGTSQPCAWDHPFRALPPNGTPRIAGGDTLIIGEGNYRMGYGAPGADACDAGGAYDCLMPPIPSGPDSAHRTRLLGTGWNSGCASPPQLWGAERPWFIVNLTDASNVEVACLEITDHSACVESHTGGLACERDTPPYGDWASTGLYAEDSANVYLHDLNIHGLALNGVLAGRLTDWTVENVRIAGNGSAGWDGDLWDENGDSNAGTMAFHHWTVEWNGCGETYPGAQPTGCWAQSAGGYGDGVGTGESGGHWIVEDSVIRNNTSDGLDFLYIREPGSSIEIRRTLVAGNAGNQIKSYRGPLLLENSIVVGNCAFFEGQSFTYNVDPCRAYGAALAVGLTRGDQATVVNNTITSEGDCVVTAECYGTCDGIEQITLRNNVLQGQVDAQQPSERSCLVYQETFPADPFDVDYSVIDGVKDDLCPGTHDQCGVSPGLLSTAIDSFDAHLLATSPAIGHALASMAPAGDFDGHSRDAQPDIGAYEYGATQPLLTATPTATSTTTTHLHLPLTMRAGTPTPTSTPSPTPTPTTAPPTNTPVPGTDNPNPPAGPVKLVFIHHSTGGNWLADSAGTDIGGDLGRALRDNNYYVSAVNYGWAVDGDAIGDRTDIGHWWEWFRGPQSAQIVAALYNENDQNFGGFGEWPRLATNPGGENQIILFKSCFPNSALQGNPSAAPPPIADNPLRGQDASSDAHTVANAKGIYIDLLDYFRTRQDKLFVVITAPPLQDGTWAANARAFNNWLINDWLTGYPYKNVAVFDFYNILTSNAGNPDSSDLGQAGGNHHRWWNGAVQHQQTVTSDTAAYPSGDDHPNHAGNEKATAEFVQLLNVFYHRWAGH